MTQNILTEQKFPFCPGCGHGVAVKNISKALTGLGYDPLDVVVVSDIGCSGLVDPLFATHTIHGLHGRAPALGLGISIGLSAPEKKVLVIQGDGGVTIGLQHVLEAARRNADLTLVVLNNQLYGMTGGQMSGLSTNDFKDFKHFPDEAPPFDIIRLAHQAGAGFAARVKDPKDFQEKLTEAFAYKGFSIVEVSSMCTSYAFKKWSDFQEVIEPPASLLNIREAPRYEFREGATLFNEEEVLPQLFESPVEDKVGVVIAGSAGGGIQSAAMLLANAGILSGLHATMKGEYPITVGTGFSMAEVILSRHPINYTGLEAPEAVLIVTSEGLQKVKGRIAAHSRVFIDSSLEPAGLDDAVFHPFQKIYGKKGAALKAVQHWVTTSGVIPEDAFFEAIHRHKYAAKLLETISQKE